MALSKISAFVFQRCYIQDNTSKFLSLHRREDTSAVGSPCRRSIPSLWFYCRIMLHLLLRYAFKLVHSLCLVNGQKHCSSELMEVVIWSALSKKKEMSRSLSAPILWVAVPVGAGGATGAQLCGNCLVLCPHWVWCPTLLLPA